MPDNNKLPKEVIDIWPEVFKHIEIKAIPVAYLKTIRVYFQNGKVWVIEVDEQKFAKEDPSVIEEILESFFDEYDDEIESIDFSLNTEKVKKDIQKRTRLFMKKRK